MKRIQKLVSMLEFQSIDSTDKYFKLDVREVYKAYQQLLDSYPERYHTPDKRWSFNISRFNGGMYIDSIWYRNDNGMWCVYNRGGAGYNPTLEMIFYSGDPKNIVSSKMLTSRLYAMYKNAKKDGKIDY